MSVQTEIVRCVILLLATAVVVAPSSAQSPKPVVIGVVMDGPWERNAAVSSLFEKEIRDILAGEFDVRFPESARIVSDHSSEGIRAALDSLYEDPQVDVVLALGPLASHEACRRAEHPVPTFAPFVIDRDVQDLPAHEGTSGVRNLNYLDVYSAPQRNIEVFRELKDFESIAVLVSESIVAAIPRLASNLRTFLGQLELSFSLVPVTGAADEVLSKIPAGVEAAYVTPLLTLTEGELERLAAGLIERRIPSFALWGPEPVESGFMFTLTPETFLPRLSRRVALNVQRALLGEDAGTLAYTFTRDERLIINMATARAVGVWPRWETLTEAELLNEEPVAVGEPLSLYDAVREAIAANLDLAARGRAVESGREEIRRARSALRPQLDLFASQLVIDEDRAAASFGSQAERTSEIGASFEQVVFSEPALANVKIQRLLQRAREHDRASLRLDIAVQAATAYLNVLRTRTFERIQKDDLKRTRSNLELARVRREIGFSGPAEVYRWESEVAQARIAVREAEAQRRVAELLLNRILHRPAERPVNTIEADIEHPDLITSAGELDPFVNNPYKFKIFRRFLVEEGLRNSPEIERLEELIAAQRRALDSARRAFWAPTGVLRAEWASKNGSGAGSNGGLADLLPDPVPGLTEADDDSWSVALAFSLPLYQGDARRADARAAERELERLEIEREAAAERIEQDVRSNLHQTGSSSATIRLARTAAEAATKNLELVTDAYSRGAIDLLDLLDAQNAALVADLQSANAVHEFLIDVFGVERAIGSFFLMLAPESRDAFFARLTDYFEINDPSFRREGR